MTDLFYRELFNAAPTPLIVTDLQGKIKLINDKAIALLDNKTTTFLELNFCDFIDSSFLKDYLNSKESFSFDEFLEVYKTEPKHWVKSKEGARIYADIKAVAFRSDNQDYHILTFDPIEISKKLSYDLKERVKEQLSILNVIEVFFNNPDIRVALKLCLMPIAQGLQYPEVTGVRIVLAGGEEFTTDNFKETDWLLKSKLSSATSQYGFLEVCYLSQVPAYDDTIFLYEEERLIDLLAKLLGTFIEHLNAIDKVKSGALLLKKITSQVPANTYQFEILPNGDTKILFMSKGNEAYNHSVDTEDLENGMDKILGVIYEADRANYRRATAKAMESKIFLSVHYRVVVNDVIRWRWFRALPDIKEEGRTIWYGASQDITPIVDYIISIEQILFDISHIVRRPVANIIGITKYIGDHQLTEKELRDMAKNLLKASNELDVSIRELNTSYDNRRKIKQDFDINFSSLIDRREDFFDGRE